MSTCKQCGRRIDSTEDAIRLFIASDRDERRLLDGSEAAHARYLRMVDAGVETLRLAAEGSCEVCAAKKEAA